MADAFKNKLEAFGERFKRFLSPKTQGYDELSTLEAPLVNVEDQEEYTRTHGVAPPQAAGDAYRPPGAAAARPGAGSFTALQAAVPSQAEEMRELAVLSRDAAEILWEMAAMGEGGAAVEDMRGKAQQLQAQLRGIISDYTGGDEALFAEAFEAFDMLSRCLEEQSNPAAAAAPAAAVPADVAAAPAGVALPPAAGSSYDKPLIEL